MPSHDAIHEGQRLTDYASYDVEVRRVTRGGFGLVAMGPCRLHDGRWYAVKMMRPEVLGHSARVRDLFVREALTWMGLWPHANVLIADAVTTINGQPCLILDYAEHGNLRDMLRGGVPFPTRLAWAQMIAAGLQSLHTASNAMLRTDPIVHRDLKPENILIHSSRYAKIADFGLAKALDGESAAAAPTPDEEQGDTTHSRRVSTARGQAIGTPAYMAPEQWEDAASAGPPADVYAFGIILSELLADRHPLLDLGGRHAVDAWRSAHRARAPRRLDEVVPYLPGALQAAYERCLAKDPGRRPTAGQMLTALQDAARALGQEPYAAPEVLARTREHEQAIWGNLANAYSDFGLLPEALDCISRALALDPDNAILLLTRGNILDRLGRADDAQGAWDASLAAWPAGDGRGRSQTLISRGIGLMHAGRFAEAEAALLEAVTLAPNDPVGWSNRGLNELAWGRAEMDGDQLERARPHYEHALSHLRRAAALNPDDPRYAEMLPGIQYDLANMLCDLRYYVEADAAYAQLLAQAPDDADAWHNRGDNQGKWGRQELAAGRLEEARGHFAEGLRYAERASSLNPGDPDTARLLIGLQAMMASVDGHAGGHPPRP